MRQLLVAVLAAILPLVCASGQDVGDKPVGVWKLNLEKTTFPNPPQKVVMTIEKRGAREYREVFDG
jgi:hypothetical protein